jgi:hypothetical protein
VVDEVVWTTAPLGVTGFSPLAGSGDAVATVTMNMNGVGEGTYSPNGSGFSEDWHNGAPAASNPEDYEVYLSVASGLAPDTGPAVDTWFPLSSSRVWTLTADGTTVVLLQGWWDITVRLIGDASSAVTKRIAVQAVSETGE